MRQLTSFTDTKAAELFADYLIDQNIMIRLDDDDPSEYVLWIYHDDDLPRAQNLLYEFLSNPDDEKFHNAKGATQEFEKQILRELREAKKQHKDLRTEWSKQAAIRAWPPLTTTILIITILVGLISKLGSDVQSVRFLFIADFARESSMLSYLGNLHEVKSGQIWRLITPIFLHFGFMHLFFNSWWLKDLGPLIENKHGSFYLFALIVAIAVPSNVAQFYVSGPTFGGLSGVVYGLLGFLWMRGKFDPYYGIRLNPQIITFMGIWFVVCLLGLMGPVANTVHGVGALAGMAWGYLSAARFKR